MTTKIRNWMTKLRLKESQFDSKKGTEAIQEDGVRRERKPRYSSHTMAKRVGISHASYERGLRTKKSR
jgi:hypothetical protein